MRRRMYLTTGIALVGVLGVAACGGGSTAEGGGADSVELVMAVDTNPGDPLSDTLVFFAEELEERSEGRITVDAHYGGSIGDEVATIEMLRSGQIDVVVVGSDISTLDPIFNIMEMPFLFPDRETIAEFLDGDYGREMSESLKESAGLIIIGYGENGFRHITNNTRPITVPDDLDGLKLRVPEVPARVETFRAMGAVPMPMSFGEIYLALDQGVIDGQENPLLVIEQSSFHEVQEFLSLSGHVYTAASLTMNASSYDGLSSELQQIVDEAAAAAVERSRQSAAEQESSTIAVFEEAGVEVNEIDMAAFREAARELWPSLAEEIPGDFGTRVLEEYGN